VKKPINFFQSGHSLSLSPFVMQHDMFYICDLAKAQEAIFMEGAHIMLRDLLTQIAQWFGMGM
jgi:hypothetical protein